MESRFGHPNTIYTIGHSNCRFEDILNLLKAYGIQMLVDIRARSSGGFFPEFRKRTMKMKLANQGVVYVFLGEALSENPNQEGFKTSDGELDYVRWENCETFKKAVRWLIDQSRYSRICLFSGPRDPYLSHRHYLVGQNLLAHGLAVSHILLDGSLEKASPDLFHRPPSAGSEDLP